MTACQLCFATHTRVLADQMRCQCSHMPGCVQQPRRHRLRSASDWHIHCHHDGGRNEQRTHPAGKRGAGGCKLQRAAHVDLLNDGRRHLGEQRRHCKLRGESCPSITARTLHFLLQVVTMHTTPAAQHDTLAGWMYERARCFHNDMYGSSNGMTRHCLQASQRRAVTQQNLLPMQRRNTPRTDLLPGAKAWFRCATDHGHARFSCQRTHDDHARGARQLRDLHLVLADPLPWRELHRCNGREHTEASAKQRPHQRGRVQCGRALDSVQIQGDGDQQLWGGRVIAASHRGARGTQCKGGRIGTRLASGPCRGEGQTVLR